MEKDSWKGENGMATELAKAYVQIIPSAKGMQGKIGEELGSESSEAGTSSGNSFASFFKKAIVASGLGIAVKKVFSDAFSEGAALQQSLGGVETLFKGSADKLKAYANEAYTTAGLSANDYMEQVTSFSASLLQSLGGDTDKAADVANMALIDMSDNANKFGTDMQDIQNAYQGFAKQNYTMLDNLKLGYGGTKEEMSRLLKDAQALTGVEYDINNLSDVYNAIHAIQENLDITGTTAKESSTTWSGSLASVKASYENLMANLMLGNDLGPYLQALASTVTTFITDNFIPAVINILTGLPEAIVTMITILAPKMIELGGNMVSNFVNGISSLLTVVSSEGSETLGTFVDGIVNNIPTLIQGTLTCVTNFINTVVQSLPSIIKNGSNLLFRFVDGILNQMPTLIKSAVTSVGKFVNTVLSNLPSVLAAGKDALLRLVDGIINNLPQIITAGATSIIKFVASIAQNLPQVLQSGIQIIGELAAGLIRSIPDLVGRIPEIISAIINTFLSTDWISVGVNIIQGIANGLANAGAALWDAVKGVLGNFKDKVLSFFGIHSPSRWGMYVGEMIDAGFASGITDNISPITRAVNALESEATKPFSSDFAYSISRGSIDVSNNNDNLKILSRLDALIELMEYSVKNGKETRIVFGNREVTRTLRDMGVVFN